MATFNIGDKVILDVANIPSRHLDYIFQQHRELKTDTVTIEKILNRGTTRIETSYGSWPANDWFFFVELKGYHFPSAYFVLAKALTETEKELRDLTTMGIRYGYPKSNPVNGYPLF